MSNTTGATDSAARPQWKISGALLIATAIATVVAVVGRVAADADQETLAQSLAYIRVNSFEYGVGGGARLVSGITLIVAAALLMRTWIIRERFATPVVPALFIGSGALTTISGACAIALVASVSGGGERRQHPGRRGRDYVRSRRPSPCCARRRARLDSQPPASR